MSETTETGDGKPEVIDKKSEDKQEIEDEERKKMIGGGEEVSRSEVEKKKKALEEAAEGTAKKRAPTGGIRVPGFLRVSRSRDKNKEGDGEGDEATDLLETPTDAKTPEEQPQQQPPPTRPLLAKLNLNVPFIKRKKQPSEDNDEVKQAPAEDQEEPPRRPKLINAIKLPIASLVPKKFQKKDSEDTPPPAGLASMETLDESNGSKQEDKMETIKLDNVELDPEKAALEDEAQSKWAKKDWEHYWEIIKEYRMAVGGVSIFLILLIILLLYVTFGSKMPVHAPIMNGKYINAVTSCGLVEGILEDSIFVFRGIPYAKPPVGERRFAPPEALTLSDCWNSTFKAHNVTPSCWQMFANGSIDGTEDCLTIDVFTPHVRYQSPVPVIVALGLQELELKPTIVRSKDVVLIIPRVRQGPFGFMATHHLSTMAYPRTSGNYGLADLISALTWVKLNVEHFGGNPKEVTVVGWRQGATLATALTAIYKPEKLFSRLWLSSGSSVFPNMTLLESEKESEEYIRGLPCPASPSASCLRRLDVEDLLDAVPDSWRPLTRGTLPATIERRHQWLVVDGSMIRESPYTIWQHGEERVQVVLGTTVHSEVNKAWKDMRSDYTEEDVLREISASLVGKRNLTEKVLTFYNATVSGLAEMISDIATVCPLYFLHQKIPGAKFYLLKQTDEDELVYGGSDISSIFGWVPSVRPPFRRSGSSLQHMFHQFTSLGKPLEYRSTIVSQDPVQLQEGLPRCQFWKDAGFSDFAWVD